VLTLALIDVLAIEAEDPDTARAAEFGGHGMVQSYRVRLPDGATGRCWIPTSEALAIERFGRGWVAAELKRLARARGAAGVHALLVAPEGLRLGAPSAREAAPRAAA
jgi:hypothetical protein